MFMKKRVSVFRGFFFLVQEKESDKTIFFAKYCMRVRTREFIVFRDFLYKATDRLKIVRPLSSYARICG